MEATEKQAVAVVVNPAEKQASDNLAYWLKLLMHIDEEIYETINTRHDMGEPMDMTSEARADVVRFCCANPKVDPFMLTELSTWDIPDEVKAEIVTLSHVFDTLEIASA